jgi:molybdate transport system substrate-binding protein
LKRTLLNAKSIGFNGQGASRAGIEAMFAKLGIADDVKPKIKLLDVSAPVAAAKGDVELALSPVSEIVAVSGAQLAGPVPADVQSYLVLSGAVAADSENAGAAKALIKFLTAPSAATVLKAKGMEPG